MFWQPDVSGEAFGYFAWDVVIATGRLWYFEAAGFKANDDMRSEVWALLMVLLFACSRIEQWTGALFDS
jgi:hypothetical protein